MQFNMWILLPSAIENKPDIIVEYIFSPLSILFQATYNGESSPEEEMNE